MMTTKQNLKELTGKVRIAKGSGAALSFYAEYIQPIKMYFKDNKIDTE